MQLWVGSMPRQPEMEHAETVPARVPVEHHLLCLPVHLQANLCSQNAHHIKVRISLTWLYCIIPNYVYDP